MRFIAAILLLAVCGHAAETGAQRGLRVQAEQAAQKAAFLASARDGLVIVHYNYQSRGWGWVRVRNITSQPAMFDYREARGLELDTGNITDAADVRFEVTEIASYEVAPGAERVFEVFFFGGRPVAAAAWKDRSGWCANSTQGKSLEVALADARKEAVAERLARKKSVLTPVKGQIVQK